MKTEIGVLAAGDPYPASQQPDRSVLARPRFIQTVVAAMGLFAGAAEAQGAVPVAGRSTDLAVHAHTSWATGPVDHDPASPARTLSGERVTRIITIPSTTPGQPPNKIEVAPMFSPEVFSGFFPPQWDAHRNTLLEDQYFAPSPTTQHLLPSLNGFRQRLGNYGVGFQMSYKAEALGVASGGKERGMEYIHEVNFRVDLDLKKMLGLDGWSVHGLILERAGRSVGKQKLGDYYINYGEIYGLSGNSVAHLGFLYAEKRFLNNRVDIIFGRMPLSTDFATSPLICTFMLLCSAPVALKLDAGLSVYPKASWGARIRMRPTRDTVLQFGAYQVRPTASDISGWAWAGEETTGAAFPVEFTWQPFFGSKKLVGHYKVGYMHDTSIYADNIGKLSPALAKANGVFARTSQRDSVWVLFDQMIYRSGGVTQMDGAYVLAGYVHNTPRNSIYSDEAWAGASFAGLIPGRNHDRLGVLYNYYRVSPRLEAGQRIREDAGFSLGATVAGPQKTTSVIEVNYGIDAMHGLLVQPEFEYVFRPGGTSRIPNAAVLGVKVIGIL
ncbi:carbohydrate porin [Acetobacter nitrogenifigens]|nr:carbohydrate porin [Acetobacter nitrogenifigens]